MHLIDTATHLAVTPVRASAAALGTVSVLTGRASERLESLSRRFDARADRAADRLHETADRAADRAADQATELTEDVSERMDPSDQSDQSAINPVDGDSALVTPPPSYASAPSAPLTHPVY